ncbi:MAG: hypothetical protein VKI63_06485 [Cyanobium sp.]|nr:hypothetical protein [Cyanobium sp.]
MFKTFSLTRGALLAGAAAAPFLFASPEAKAICLGGNSVCETFTPETISTPTLPAGYFTGIGQASSTFTRVRIAFTYTPPAGSPASFTLNNILLGGQGLGTSPVSMGSPAASGSLLVPTGSQVFTDWVTLTAPITPGNNLNFVNSTLSFSIPGGVLPVDTTLSAQIIYGTAGSAFKGSNTFNTIAEVPGPLSLLGLAAVASQSRRLKRKFASDQV